MKKPLFIFASIFMLMVISACSDSAPEEESQEMDHSSMEHSNSGDVPEDVKESENPAFPVGSTAILKEGHMEDMKGAEATIAGAYDTIAYSVSYTPTQGKGRRS